jgi:hypothetical protein
MTWRVVPVRPYPDLLLPALEVLGVVRRLEGVVGVGRAIARALGSLAGYPDGAKWLRISEERTLCDETYY